MSSSFRSPVAALLALVALTTDGLATTFLAEGHTVRVWQTQDGLPQNLVRSAVQTRDGYLWFATESGLARFDGERFQVFNSANTPELRDRRITRLFEDAEGTLWIGHETGAITRHRAGEFELFSPPADTENERIIGLGSDEQGRVWAMRGSGAVDSLFEGRRLRSLLPSDQRPAVMDWTWRAPGRIWLAENGQIASLTNGALEPLTLSPPRTDGYVLGVAAAADGGVWVLRDGRIQKWKDGNWIEDRGDFPWPAGPLVSCRELRDGTLAVGTIQSGLYLIFRDGRKPAHFDRTNGLPQNWVRFLYEDREGNLWAGTGSAGLVSIHATAFSVLSSPDQWRGCTVVSVAPGKDGALWVGTDGAGLYYHAAGQWKYFRENEGLANGYIQAVTETPAGDVWAGNFWWGSPYRLQDGKFIRPENVDPAWSPALALVAIPETGELLVGNRDGLLKLDGRQSTWLIKSPSGPAGDVSALVRDRDGTIWCGFAQGGLARLADGKLTFFRRKDGLASDAILSLFSDDDGSLWIGTADGGLNRFKDGRFSNLNMARGLADNTICHILDDGQGHYWLSTRHGLQRVAKEELNRCADGSIPSISGQTYNRSDGLPVVEFTGGRQAAGCRTMDGRLWFASSQGVLCVDPARIVPNPTLPPVIAETLLVDGKELPLVAGAVLERLAPGHQRLEFWYTALSYVAPDKVQFKYRLDGLDNDWIDAGPKRTASYSHLSAGTYRFRVIACNNDGVWNTQGSALAFTVAPYFWRTWWFIGASVGAGLGIAAFSARSFTRRRMQRQMEEMERRHTLERERARIAQDIHDDVGASLSQIAMLSQPARSDLAAPERTAVMLSRIYATAREVTRSLDEIVWAVDPRHDTLDSLVDYMGKFAQEFLASAKVRCRLDLPVQVPPWPLTAETRHNLFLSFKEALNNALKHASASEVGVTLSLFPKEFVLLVKDNGRGIAESRTAPDKVVRLASGNGLANMKTRLTRIGGRCEITSEPGSGTTVAFTVYVAGENLPRPVGDAVAEEPIL
jgi:ligand-binding sensor domain-containing protein/signal transduction histidine kinase